MADEWIEEPFPEVIDFQEGPGIMARDFRDEGVPLVRLAGLDRGRSVLSGCNYLDPEMVARKWAHFELAKGDILLSTSASLGRIAVVGEDAVGAISYTGIIRMRPRDGRLIAPFIRYLLEGPDFQQQAEIVGVGSVIRHFGPMHLRQMSVRLPPPDEQRAIAHILGALDDKIDLNRGMNETLEAMARALFKSWFVDFDPVRAKMDGGDPGLPQFLASLFPDSLHASDLGDVPKGWRSCKIADLCEAIYSGGTPSTQSAEYWDGDVPWLSSGETREKFIIDTEKRITRAGVENSSTRAASALSTVIASAGQGNTRGQTSLLAVDCYVNQSVVVLRANPKTSSPLTLFFDLERRYEEFRQVSDGHSSRGSLTTKLLAGLDAVLPPLPLVQHFESTVSPLIERAVLNLRESKTLAALRDALLPKLISGELRIADAERPVA